MKSNKLRKPTPVKAVVLIIALVGVLGVGYGVSAYSNDWWPFSDDQNHSVEQSSSETQEESSSDTGINYGPPSKQDIEESQEGKKNTSGGSTNTSNKKIEVAISEASKDAQGNVEIRAFTPSVVEGTGTCTATLTSGGATVTKSSAAFVDASTSICKPIIISSSQFKVKGTWSLTVSYKSTTGQGISDVVEVNL